MASSKEMLKMINHYKKSLEVPQVEDKRIIHCIGVLYKLAVTVTLLQETGIGRTVNALCKSEVEQVRSAAKGLVNKWKALVVNESSAEDEPAPPPPPPPARNTQEVEEKEKESHRKKHHSSRSSTTHSRDKDRDREHRTSHHNNHHKLSSSSTSGIKNNGQEGEESLEKKHQHHHQSSSSSRHHHHEGRSSDREGREHRVTNGHEEKEREKERPHHTKEAVKEGHVHSSKHERSSGGSSSRNGKQSHEEQEQDPPREKDEKKKRSRENEDGQKNRPSKRHRHDKEKVKREMETEEEQEIDGSAGTSFADALAMMDGPSSSSKPAKATGKVTSTDVLASSSTTKASSSRSSTASTSHSHSSMERNSGDTKRKSLMASSSKSSSNGSKSTLPINSGSGPPNLLAPSTKLAPLLDPEELKRDILGPSVVISNTYTPANYLNPVNLAGVSAAIQKNKRTGLPPGGPSTEPFEILQSRARTKVYSGNKCAAVVLSLHEMCIRVLQKNVDALEYTGGVPFDILEPVLVKCSAPQLEQIEYYNPYLAEDTNDLWKMHVGRQFRGKKRMEMESWAEMYQRCQQEEQDRLSSLTESIKHAQQTSIPVKQTKLAYMDRQLPHMGRRRGGGFGAGGGGGGGPSINASLTNRTTVSGTRMGFLTAGREVQAKRAPLMQKTLALMKKSIKR